MSGVCLVIHTQLKHHGQHQNQFPPMKRWKWIEALKGLWNIQWATSLPENELFLKKNLQLLYQLWHFSLDRQGGVKDIPILVQIWLLRKISLRVLICVWPIASSLVLAVLILSFAVKKEWQTLGTNDISCLPVLNKKWWEATLLEVNLSP